MTNYVNKRKQFKTLDLEIKILFIFDKSIEKN